MQNLQPGGRISTRPPESSELMWSAVAERSGDTAFVTAGPLEIPIRNRDAPLCRRTPYVAIKMGPPATGRLGASLPGEILRIIEKKLDGWWFRLDIKLPARFEEGQGSTAAEAGISSSRMANSKVDMHESRTILQVEDDEDDVLFLQIAMQEAKVTHPLKVALDGREAIAYLNGDGKFANRRKHPVPGLILLDLKLPCVSGLRVLEWIRERAQFIDTPVLVLSTSAQEVDVNAAYGLGANGYLVKPASIRDLVKIVRLVKKYWLDLPGPPLHSQDWEAVSIPANLPLPPLTGALK
jgi:CheY-like chemotaxis protein